MTKKIYSGIGVLCALVTLLLASNSCKERFEDLQRQINDLKASQISTIDEQIESIKSSIIQLQKIDDALVEQVNSDDKLENAEQKINNRIDELKYYVDNQLKGKTDWASATFSTLEQYRKTCDAIAELRLSIDDMPSQMCTLIINYRASMESWVNEKLNGYFTIADANARLQNLEDRRVEGDAALSARIDSLRSIVLNMERDLGGVYEGAIIEAINNSGVISNEVALRLDEATADLESRMEDLDMRICKLEDAISSLEYRMDVHESIQDIVYVPAYSDGKTAMWYSLDTLGNYNNCLDSLHFEICPRGSASQLYNLFLNGECSFQVKAVYNEIVKSGVESVDLPVLSVNCENEVLTVEVSGEYMDWAFFDGLRGASCSLWILSRGTQKMSEYIQMRPKQFHTAFFEEDALTVMSGDSVEVQVFRFPDNAVVTFEVSNSEIISVDEDGVITALNPGVATLYVKTIHGFSDSIEIFVVE